MATKKKASKKAPKKTTKKAAGALRKERVVFLVSKDELAGLKANAKKGHVGVSAFVRNALGLR